MLDLGAIRPSNSPWALAIVLVRKKDGRLRFCIDLQGKIQGALGPWPPLYTKNKAPAPKFYKIEAPEW